MTATTSVGVREELVRALRLDLVGPAAEHPADADYESERLPMSPSRWYLTGFLVPSNAPEEQLSDEASKEELDLAGDADIDGDDDRTPEKQAARRVRFPSSIGLSVLITHGVDALVTTATWGDYEPESAAGDVATGEGEPGASTVPVPRDRVWKRIPRSQEVRVAIPASNAKSRPTAVPNSNGLKIYVSVRSAGGDAASLPPGTRAVAVFLVNERTPAPSDEKDRAFAFQATLQLECESGFVARPDPRRGTDDEWDDRVADLQYANVFEYATGHGVSADWRNTTDGCTTVWTTWTPCDNVPFVEPAKLETAMLGMEALATASADELTNGLAPLTREYNEWIDKQRSVRQTDAKRQATATDLLSRADAARKRIEQGNLQAGRSRDSTRLSTRESSDG